VLARVPLDLPPQVFETEGLWVEVPDRIRVQAEAAKLHFMGGIHAMEHALIGLMPLVVLCDRGDLGGISHPWHEQAGSAAVFVYDGYTGGMGLTARAFASMHALLDQTGRWLPAGANWAAPPASTRPGAAPATGPLTKRPACSSLTDSQPAAHRRRSRGP
jgi:DEAD/DEAH box helicase domain-containing protein